MSRWNQRLPWINSCCVAWKHHGSHTTGQETAQACCSAFSGDERLCVVEDKRARRIVLWKGLESHYGDKDIARRYRQVISHTCRRPEVLTQQSWAQMITAAMYILSSFTRPFLLISFSEDGSSRVSTVLIKMSSCGLCHTVTLYSLLCTKRHVFCLMETTFIFSLSCSRWSPFGSHYAGTSISHNIKNRVDVSNNSEQCTSGIHVDVIWLIKPKLTFFHTKHSRMFPQVGQCALAGHENYSGHAVTSLVIKNSRGSPGLWISDALILQRMCKISGQKSFWNKETQNIWGLISKATIQLPKRSSES